MPGITFKHIPPELHAQLKAEANFRSLQQEALYRLERSFATDDQLSTAHVNRLLDESLASGPEEAFSWAKFDAAIAQARRRHATKNKAQ